MVPDSTFNSFNPRVKVLINVIYCVSKVIASKQSSDEEAVDGISLAGRSA
jgi:hypothetical protein